MKVDIRPSVLFTYTINVFRFLSEYPTLKKMVIRLRIDKANQTVAVVAGRIVRMPPIVIRVTGIADCPAECAAI